jgi:signal transduction histidine kinase
MRARRPQDLEFILAFGFAVLALWAVIGWMLYAAHGQAIRNAAAERHNLARSLAEYEDSSVRAIDLSLRALRDEWMRSRESFGEAVARHEEYLRKEKVIQIAVTDADGYLLYSRLPQAPTGSFADREYFQVQKASDHDQLYISEPVMGRVTKQWAIQITRALYDPATRRFAGILVVAVPPPALQLVYRDIDVGPHGAITLARGDGRILAGTGVAPASLPAGSLASGDLRTAGQADGIERFYSYRGLSSYPLTVFVGQGIDTVLAPYYAQRRLMLAGGGLGTLMLVALAALAISRARQRRQFLDDRERLMFDLHDSCIQAIYAIGLGLENCRRLMEKDPARATALLADAGANLNLVIQDLRAFIAGQAQPPRSQEEFLAELHRSVPELADGGPQVSFDIEQDAVRALNGDQALHVLRIAREALSNVVRHANARTARMSLVLRERSIRLDVVDDGDGMRRPAREGLGLGLHHIEARARKLGGKASIGAAPPRGTHIAVEFPQRP